MAHGPPNAGTFNSSIPLSPTPVLRDTATVNAGSYLVLRFVASNRGVWIFHCEGPGAGAGAVWGAAAVGLLLVGVPPAAPGRLPVALSACMPGAAPPRSIPCPCPALFSPPAPAGHIDWHLAAGLALVFAYV